MRRISTYKGGWAKIPMLPFQTTMILQNGIISSFIPGTCSSFVSPLFPLPRYFLILNLPHQLSPVGFCDIQEGAE